MTSSSHPAIIVFLGALESTLVSLILPTVNEGRKVVSMPDSKGVNNLFYEVSIVKSEPTWFQNNIHNQSADRSEKKT